MTEKIKALTQFFIHETKHHAHRQAPIDPCLLAEKFCAENTAPQQRSVQRLLYMLQNEQPVVFPEERIAFMADVCKVAEAIHKLYKPAKVNYGAYGDTGCHLHFHLVPKYTGEFEWGGTFAMNPQLKTLDDAAYSALVAELKAELGL